MLTTNSYLTNGSTNISCKTWKRGKLCFTIMLFQSIICLLLTLFAVYEETADPSDRRNSVSKAIGGFDQMDNPIERYLPHLRDHVMFSLLGLGLSSTSSSTTMLSSLGFNLMTFNFASSWGLLWPHLITSPWESIKPFQKSSSSVSFPSSPSPSSTSGNSTSVLSSSNLTIINSKLLSTQERTHIESTNMASQKPFHITFGINSILKSAHYGFGVTLSLGSLHGKLSPIQCIILAAIEVPIISLTDYILASWQVADESNGLIIFTFSVYFGLSISTIICRRSQAAPRIVQQYDSDRELLMLLGTILAYLTLTSSYTLGDEKYYLAINNCISVVASCLSSFAISSLLDSQNRFSVRHLRIGSAAGGVVMSIIGQYVLYPYIAFIAGMIIGVLSIVTHIYINPYLFNHLRIHDTLSIHATYGIPAVISGFASSIFAYKADLSSYDCSLYEIFPARAPPKDSSSIKHEDIQALNLHQIYSGIGRSAFGQAFYQLFGLIFIVSVAITTGLIAGIILIQSVFDPPKQIDLQDEHYWVLSDEGEDGFATESLYESDPSPEDIIDRNRKFS